MINRRLRNIVVPKDQNSLIHAYSETADDIERCYFTLPIENDVYFSLFKVFEKINLKLDILIDDAEETEIHNLEELKILREFLNDDYEINNMKGPISFYVERLKKLVGYAIHYKTAVIFLL